MIVKASFGKARQKPGKRHFVARAVELAVPRVEVHLSVRQAVAAELPLATATPALSGSVGYFEQCPVARYILGELSAFRPALAHDAASPASARILAPLRAAAEFEAEEEELEPFQVTALLMPHEWECVQDLARRLDLEEEVVLRGLLHLDLQRRARPVPARARRR